MLRVLVSALFLSSSMGFSPMKETMSKTTVDIETSRREVFSTSVVSLLGFLSLPSKSNAFSQQLPDDQVEESQLPTDGKIDVNNAFVGEYMQFRGMFPHAAGKIASNGPYKSISDIYKIKDLTQHDIQMFKKYQRELTVNPPGRAFHERINARVST